MSLMKLLSVSRSFVSGGRLHGRYKMAEQGMLPKFESAKPFGSSVSPGASQPAEASGAPGVTGVSAVNGAVERDLFTSSGVVPVGGAGDTPGVPAGDSGGKMGGEGEGKVGRRVEVGSRWSLWRRNPFRQGEDGEAGRGVGGQQGELALEQVRVVRNDLRDADFEVIQPAAAPVPGRGVGNGGRFPGARMAGAAWNRLTSRVGGGSREGL